MKSSQLTEHNRKKKHTMLTSHPNGQNVFFRMQGLGVQGHGLIHIDLPASNEVFFP